MSKPTKAQQAERSEAIERLKQYLPPGSELLTLVTHVARSGMSRRIRCFAIDSKDLGLVVGGCGMDMGFHLAHSLSYSLHGRESVGDKAREYAEKGRHFEPTATDYRAGYSIRHRWL